MFGACSFPASHLFEMQLDSCGERWVTIKQVDFIVCERWDGQRGLREAWLCTVSAWCGDMRKSIVQACAMGDVYAAGDVKRGRKWAGDTCFSVS